MAGTVDPREESVEPVEPDFTLTMDNSEIGATYEVALISLFELFYQDIQGWTAEEMYAGIEERTNLLYEDIIAIMGAMLPAIVLIGVADALIDVFASMAKDRYLLTSSEKEELTQKLEKKVKVNNNYSETDQKLTVRAIVDEVKNDLKTSSHFIKARQEKEPDAKVKTGNIVSRAVNRIKRMVIHGVMSSYNTGKKAYYNFVYKKDTTYDWITKHDSDVCPFCNFFEANNPYTMDELPPCPYHIWCRCTFRPTDGSRMRVSFTNILKNIMGMNK